MDKIICHTPTPNKQPTRIDPWKYDLIHDAIMDLVPDIGEGVVFKELAGMIRAHLREDELEDLGSVGWYTATVKLHMETTGELIRVPKSKPQRLLRSTKKAAK